MIANLSKRGLSAEQAQSVMTTLVLEKTSLQDRKEKQLEKAAERVFAAREALEAKQKELAQELEYEKQHKVAFSETTAVIKKNTLASAVLLSGCARECNLDATSSDDLLGIMQYVLDNAWLRSTWSSWRRQSRTLAPAWARNVSKCAPKRRSRPSKKRNAKQQRQLLRRLGLSMPALFLLVLAPLKIQSSSTSSIGMIPLRLNDSMQQASWTWTQARLKTEQSSSGSRRFCLSRRSRAVPNSGDGGSGGDGWLSSVAGGADGGCRDDDWFEGRRRRTGFWIVAVGFAKGGFQYLAIASVS
ncbi:unnamed protein product [Prorocentrum cordatum]|uniref:Uncharacterized protein n=1 Tax=Prorocentrum cordatum TaxID=2364126 RepID=A0ABN9SHD6_9DINO|nr:unnamed protein product [Polarella glacialis]